MPQIKPLSPELQKIAIDELGEVPERIPEDLQTLKTWIWQQPHLNARTDDQFLIQFLRGSKYNMEKAKQKIDTFYTMKTKYPEFFSVTNVDDPILRRLQKTGGFAGLPTPLNGCGPRIGFIRFIASPRDFTSSEMVRAQGAAAEIGLFNDPYACICGVVLVFDFAKCTLQHILAFPPSIVKMFATFYTKGFPMRPKAIYFMNLSTYAEQVSKIIFAYMPKKLTNRVHFCGSNIEELFEHLPKKYFPQEYGGENGSLDDVVEEYNKVWDEYREYFKQNAEYGTDERLRPGGPWHNDDELGYGGTFRQLNVD